LLKKQKKTLPPEPAVPVRSRTLNEVPTLKIRCVRRATGSAFIECDPDIATGINIRRPEGNNPESDEAATKRLPDRCHVQAHKSVAGVGA
jgi:hypothetical protein